MFSRASGRNHLTRGSGNWMADWSADGKLVHISGSNADHSIRKGIGLIAENIGTPRRSAEEVPCRSDSRNLLGPRRPWMELVGLAAATATVCELFRRSSPKTKIARKPRSLSSESFCATPRFDLDCIDGAEEGIRDFWRRPEGMKRESGG